MSLFSLSFYNYQVWSHKHVFQLQPEQIPQAPPPLNIELPVPGKFHVPKSPASHNCQSADKQGLPGDRWSNRIKPLSNLG